MKLHELQAFRESVMSDRHLDLQTKIMDLIQVEDHDASEVLEFALGVMEWEELSAQAREKLYAHYENEMPRGTAKATTGDPLNFIFKALEKDLKL